MLRSMLIALAMTAGFAAPLFAAENPPPPPPPIDWSAFIDSLGETPKDFVVGEEMC